MSRKRNVFPVTYTVQGKGRFPFDMLRYDQVYPVNGESVEAMQNEDHVRGLRQVTLSGYQCTSARWNSFAWGVVTQ